MGDITLSRRKLITVALASFFAEEAAADLYDDYLNSTSKQPFVAFLARKGVPGHAFVGVGVKLEAGVVVYERFFGFYPTTGGKASEVKLVFGKVSGTLDYKWRDTKWDVVYEVNVDDVRKAAALAVTEKWKASDPKYNLFASGGANCSSFAAEVAAAAGLKAPSGAGSLLPAAYIETLKKANSSQ